MLLGAWKVLKFFVTKRVGILLNYQLWKICLKRKASVVLQGRKRHNIPDTVSHRRLLSDFEKELLHIQVWWVPYTAVNSWPYLTLPLWWLQRYAHTYLSYWSLAAKGWIKRTHIGCSQNVGHIEVLVECSILACILNHRKYSFGFLWLPSVVCLVQTSDTRTAARPVRATPVFLTSSLNSPSPCLVILEAGLW